MCCVRSKTRRAPGLRFAPRKSRSAASPCLPSDSTPFQGSTPDGLCPVKISIWPLRKHLRSKAKPFNYNSCSNIDSTPKIWARHTWPPLVPLSQAQKPRLWLKPSAVSVPLGRFRFPASGTGSTSDAAVILLLSWVFRARASGRARVSQNGSASKLGVLLHGTLAGEQK